MILERVALNMKQMRLKRLRFLREEKQGEDFLYRPLLKELSKHLPGRWEEHKPRNMYH